MQKTAVSATPCGRSPRAFPLSGEWRRAPILKAMRMLSFFLFVASLTVSASTRSQNVTISGKGIQLKKLFSLVEKQTGVVFFYNQRLLVNTKPVNVSAKEMPLEAFLRKIMEDQPLQFRLDGKTVTLSRKIAPVETNTERLPANPVQRADTLIRVTGTILSEQDEPIAGASIVVKGSRKGVSADARGNFSIEAERGQSLAVSYVGYEDQLVKVSSAGPLRIKMIVSAAAMTDLVVTGIYQRKKESFTGSSSTYTAKELKNIGNQNILQSLKTLDPSFAVLDNNIFGSDPNRLPDIEIRGKSSVIGLTEEYGTNPNQPLFILDGFESTLTIISDLSMDRVESITVLKDAAATAIYGSRAANGVVVVETKRPVPGQLRLSYNLNSSFSFADLSDYNLMNAAEKLEFEKLSGFFGSRDANGNLTNYDLEQKYFERKKEVERGVDTYWPNEPLRFAPVLRHTLMAEGGDANLRYSAMLTIGNTNGVMQGSSRDVTSGNIRLIYRKGKLSFNNSLSIDYTSASRESVPFSRFSRANPYHRKYNAQGGIDKVMESFQYLDLATFSSQTMNVYNPLYDMRNNNVNESRSQGFTNNFEIEWRIFDELRARARASVRRITTRDKIFRSPFNSEFIAVDVLQQGTYNENNSEEMNYDGDFSFTYGKLLNGRHMVNAVAGVRMNQLESEMSGYEVRGFVDDDFSNPTFAFGYPEGRRSSYQEAQRRNASFFLNTGYAYNDRFLFDATLRSDGSSVYGARKQFTSIWSVGTGWNLHNENFIRNSGLAWFDQLRLRGSIGNPGNQNFSDYISMRVYRYNNENRNPFGSSVVINNFGNSNLKWQKTLDKNIGLDVLLLDRRVRVNADYFIKNTDPLLVFVAMPSSSGVTSIAQNMGEQLTKGFTIIADYTFLRRKNFNWLVNVNMRQWKSEYRNIGNSLDQFNKENKSRNLIRYYDGGSPSDLWAVRSVGIDPVTGREVFLNSNDQQTFVHNYNDEKVVGNSDPDLEGIIGTTARYKGFSASINLRYRLGGQVFMQTLYEKVENISMANIALNQDKRALYDRWKNPGDNAVFRAISSSDVTPISSRFIANNNLIAGESISFGYETSAAAWLHKLGASSMNVRAYMNDIFRIASVVNERGLDYPFARSVSLSLGIRF